MEGDLSSPDLRGIIPRSAESIFTTLNQPDYCSHTVICSYLEIYNEDLCDLFAEEEQKKSSKVEVMQGKNGNFCRGHIEKEVESVEDVVFLMRRAQQLRNVGETRMNKHSSRSHCIFTLQINAKRFLLDGSTLEVHGKLHLVDLAGSESAKGAAGRGSEVKRDRERANINKSLLTLGRVIIMLREQSESKKAIRTRIPYRDSKLTRLLQKSLRGKCKTLVIATLSPSIASVDESISTLNYAQSATGIVNKPVDAAQYLSINSGASALATPTPSTEDSLNNQPTENWYEMECRLKYMQTQVEEAQAALARNHITHQELVDRAEKAEQYSIDMEQKYDDAKDQIRSLQRDISEEKRQKDALTLLLKKTEMQLKRTNLILEATQKTEINLTGEATALIETVQDSISDGDQLHQCLLDARECDIQRQVATRKFHSMTVTSLEDIMLILSNLSKKEEEYCNTANNSAEKGNKISHQSLDQSLKAIREITACAAALTSTIKSHAQDDEGIIPLVSKISEDVQGAIGQSKEFLMDGEEKLRASFQTGHEQLKEYSSKLKHMNSEYAISTEHLLTSLEKNCSLSKDKVLNMAASITVDLSSVRATNLETRNALNSVVSKLEKESKEAATRIKNVSDTQSGILDEGVEAFSNGMQHIRNMKIKLKEQANFIDTDGNTHLHSILTQKSMLSNQHDSIIKAKSDQKIMKDRFTAAVLNGVKSLVDEQISLLSENQTEHLTSFENSNQGLLEKNSVIGSSADNILGEVKVTNQKLLEHVQHADKNDTDMKIIAEDAKVAFISLRDTSEQQQDTIITQLNEVNTQVTELSAQDEAVGNISNKVQIEKDVIVEQVHKMIQDEKNEVSLLTDAARRQSDYTSNTVIASMLTKLVNMETPRKLLITNVLDKFDHVVNIVKEGKSQIELATKLLCNTADKLQHDVELKQEEHNKLAKCSCNDFDMCKDSIVTNAQGHMKVSVADLSTSTSHILSTKNNVEDFASNTIEYKKSISLVCERKLFSYSLNLSATPSLDRILKSLTCLQ